MRKNIFFRIVLGFLLLLFWNCKQTDENKDELVKNDPKEVREIINKKNKQIGTWIKEGNVDSAATIFADNVIQMLSNTEPIVGIDNFIKIWKENTSYGAWDFKINAKEVKVCGEMAVERGEYYLSFTPNEGALMPVFNDQGNYVVLWEKTGGEWKIVWDAPVSATPMQQDSIPSEDMKNAKVTFINNNTSRSRMRSNRSTMENKENTSSE